MIVFKTEIDVRGVSGRDISDFMMNCTDEDYRRWWNGTHLAFRTIERRPNGIGNRIYFDEYVGGRRLRLTATVTEHVPGRKIVWRMGKTVRLPAWLILEFADTEEGVRIIHLLAGGFNGPGRLLDPVLRICLPDGFERALEEHARTEFHKLADMLTRSGRGRTSGRTTR